MVGIEQYLNALLGHCLINKKNIYQGLKAYLGDDHADETGQASADIVGDNAEGHLEAPVDHSLDVSGHVLVEHALDLLAGLLVVGEDGLGAEKTSFLTSIPVEFNGVGSLALDDGLVLEDTAEGLKDGDGATSIVISTWSAAGHGAALVDAVLVSTDDNDFRGAAGDGGNDAVLNEVVSDTDDLGTVAAGTRGINDSLDLLLEPGCRLLAIVRLVIAVMERAELGQIALHVLLGEGSNHGVNSISMADGGWVGNGWLGNSSGESNLLVSDVKEVLALL